MYATNPPEVPGLRGKGRTGPGRLPSPLKTMGQAAGVPGRCLPHNPLALALAPNVFHFIAAPSLGAEIRCSLIGPCDWTHPAGAVTSVGGILRVVSGHRRSVSWTCPWLWELPDSRKQLSLSGSVGRPYASAQMVLENRRRESLRSVSASVSVMNGKWCFLKNTRQFHFVRTIGCPRLLGCF